MKTEPRIKSKTPYPYPPPLPLESVSLCAVRDKTTEAISWWLTKKEIATLPLVAWLGRAQPGNDRRDHDTASVKWPQYHPEGNHSSG